MKNLVNELANKNGVTITYCNDGVVILVNKEGKMLATDVNASEKHLKNLIKELS